MYRDLLPGELPAVRLIVMTAERAKGDAKRIGELEFALGHIQNETIPNGLEPDSHVRIARNEDAP
jgi:hypothetical protein